MVDAWPSGLPQHVLVGGYNESVADALLEYQPDAGPTITRRRSSAASRPLTVNVELTRAQLATLRTFVETTLIGGSLPFHFPASSDSSTLLVKFQKSGLPKWTALGGDYYTVTMTLWVLP